MTVAAVSPRPAVPAPAVLHAGPVTRPPLACSTFATYTAAACQQTRSWRPASQSQRYAPPSTVTVWATPGRLALATA